MLFLNWEEGVPIIRNKARDQKQNYRLKETMSLSRGGLKYVGLSLSPVFGLFDHLNETLSPNISTNVVFDLMSAHSVKKT